MSIKVTRNFDFKKLAKSKGLSEWLNQYGNTIHKSIVEGLENSESITNKPLKRGGDFTKNSIQDKHAHQKPLVRSGRLKKSLRKLPATPQKLSFTIKSIVKSKARWSVEYKGKKSSGTRNVSKTNYGYWLNKGFKTHEDSLIPNKNVKPRVWFGIPPQFLAGGSEWKKLSSLIPFFLNKYIKTRMKEF